MQTEPQIVTEAQAPGCCWERGEAGVSWALLPDHSWSK